MLQLEQWAHGFLLAFQSFYLLNEHVMSASLFSSKPMKCVWGWRAGLRGWTAGLSAGTLQNPPWRRWPCPTMSKATCEPAQWCSRAAFPWCLCFRTTKAMQAVIKPCVQHCKIRSLYKTKSKDNLYWNSLVVIIFGTAERKEKSYCSFH